jgi:uncharacterized protein (DUF433 family)
VSRSPRVPSVLPHGNQSPISSDPEVCSGQLVFRGTRVIAQSLLDWLDDGFTVDEFLDDFPSVSREDALAFLKLARGANASAA